MKKREDDFKDGEVMLDKYASTESDAAKKRTKPELDPRPARIFTPTDFFCILGRFTFFFGLGVLSRFLVKLIFKF